MEVLFINYLTFIAMFEVQIYSYGIDDYRVPVSSFPNVETALAFALDLHRVSNLPHSVVVVDEDGEVIIDLLLSPKSK